MPRKRKSPPRTDHRRVMHWRGPTVGADRAALRARCINLYVHQGLSLREVARRVDRSSDTVGRLVTEAGYTIRPRNNPDRRAMVRLELRVPEDFRDAINEYAQLRRIQYNDAVLQLLGKVLGIDWDGRRQPNGHVK